MKNPIQPLAKDARGALRFKVNRIVKHLLDTHKTCDMSRLAAMDFSDDDRQQFAQLIGYSLGGYGELSYVDDEAYSTAEAMAEATVSLTVETREQTIQRLWENSGHGTREQDIAGAYDAGVAAVNASPTQEQADIELMRLDAKRYRWMRSASVEWDDAGIVLLYPGPDFERKADEELDRIIDAEMAPKTFWLGSTRR